jgi:hypothetical protein
MGLLDIAKEALAGLPVVGVLNERLSLALDYAAQAERENETLHKVKAKLEAMLDIEKENYQKAKEELDALKAAHAEEIRIHEATEFRKGARTGGKWLPFCPVCHAPALFTNGMAPYVCSHRKCSWVSRVVGSEMDEACATLV